MSQIHPTAIIHSSAQIADDAVIGPYVCIEGHARIGQGCVIKAHAVLAGNVRIGKNNIIGYGAVIGAEPQDYDFRSKIQSEVIIGDSNQIREYCTIHRGNSEGTATVVGNHNFLMAGTHLGHNVRIGNKVILANNVLVAGHVEVQDGAFIGGGCALHPHIRVGRVAIAQGVSALAKDVPPFILVANRSAVSGLNVIGLRRAGYTAQQRGEIKEAFKLLYKSGLNTTQALARAKEMQWNAAATEFLDFVAAAGKRGICKARGSSD